MVEPRKVYKKAIGIRGDCLYCPLSLAIDSYWNCLVDCYHCYFRRLNYVWGEELRPACPNEVRKKLSNGLSNQNPKSSLAWALHQKKTLRVGNKSDPYQPIEMELRVTRQILRILIDLRWTFAIQTRFLHNLKMDEDLLTEAHSLNLLTLIPIISPGAEQDWKILERGRTTDIKSRLSILQKWVHKGWNIGVNGEPFIPGYHTVEQFRSIIQRIKSVGVVSYNTYNLHFNDYVAKRLHSIGVDIQKIWEMNQNKNWRRIQVQLCCVAEEEGIRLGCPDFVNTGKNWKERANTCCGVNVPNPSKFNTHWWKMFLQKGYSVDTVVSKTYEGIGDKRLAMKILRGIPCNNYTMRDAGLL